jgi:hypothetical protein
MLPTNVTKPDEDITACDDAMWPLGGSTANAQGQSHVREASAHVAERLGQATSQVLQLSTSFPYELLFLSI